MFETKKISADPDKRVYVRNPCQFPFFDTLKTCNLQYSLSHLWVHLNFTDEHVLGYEIMNEPWCGDVYEDPTLLVPGVADRRYLQPMYEVVL